MKVIVLGSGALKIGEAGEFDYSGSQALKALKEEGIETILVNPNIATIQTDPDLASRIYFLPVAKEFAEKIIKKKRPDGILLGFGGQTALNCGIALEGVLEKYSVKVLGTPLKAIKETEDRELFVNKLKSINVKTPKSFSVKSIKEGLASAEKIGYPVMLRVSYQLGGRGSGMAKNKEELEKMLTRAFSVSKKVLIEEYLYGWKEVEYEVMRDSEDNCIIICNMENIDPMGLHTGESAVVAPSQTLTNFEYHELRRISIEVVRSLGIVGECNIQFALSPKKWDYRIIEVNARLSRSSALASKATGYPIAYVSAKLALGKILPELKNSVTNATTACFEPSLDYIVVKIPRWDFQKFRRVERKIGSQMKSVGEVMGIGRTFEEAFQKAIRMLEIGADGLSSYFEPIDLNEDFFSDKRFFAIAKAIKKGYSIEKLNRITKIDPWFLQKFHNIVEFEGIISKSRLEKKILIKAKRLGFSDAQIAKLKGKKEKEIRALRKKFGIIPFIKQIDTLSAEYPARTNYLYLTYNEEGDDIDFEKKGVLIIGSGPYRIGSSVEFDWCAVNCARSLSKMGKRAIMVNSNPETVSTDYDICDTLYFEELTLERILDICEKENPEGVIVSMGGQTPNNLALSLHNFGFKILGTKAKNINIAEDRHKFSSLLDKLGIEQPEWKELKSLESAKDFANSIGYPVLIRPSFVLSGSSMSVVFNEKELENYLRKARTFSSAGSVVISKFIEGAKEIEFDAVAKDGEILCYAVGEHIENAGVHSGDATIILPAQRIHVQTFREARLIAKKIAKALRITGPFNIQFIAKENRVKVIELNLRASRTFPFVSKTYGINFVDIAAKAMTGERVERIEKSLFDKDYICVKAPQFSFSRLEKADPVLSVEMVSTGEVACFGKDIHEAFLKAIISTGFKIPEKSVLLSIKGEENRFKCIDWIRKLKNMNFKIYATEHTSEFLTKNGIGNKTLFKIHEGREPNVKTFIVNKKIDLVINIPFSYDKLELDDSYEIRRLAVDLSIPLITNIQLSLLFVEAIERKIELEIKSWDEYLRLK